MRQGVMNVDNRKFWLIARKYATLAILVVFVVAISLMTDRFLTFGNITNVGRQLSFNGIISVAMTMVIISGGIDLSVGGTVALAGCICAGVLTDSGNIFMAIMAALVVGTVVGLFNGVLIAYTKIAPFIITLSSLSIAKGVTLVLTNASPIPLNNEGFKALGQSSFYSIPTPIFIMLAIFLIAGFVMRKTKFGRYVYAIGGNERSAALAGIAVQKIKLIVYIISGLMAAFTGVLYTSRLSSGVPNLGDGFEMDAITAAVIGGASLSGGQGGIWGTLIGAVIIGILNNALNLLNVNTNYQSIVTGVVVLIAVLFDRLIQTRVSSES